VVGCVAGGVAGAAAGDGKGLKSDHLIVTRMGMSWSFIL